MRRDLSIFSILSSLLRLGIGEAQALNPGESEDGNTTVTLRLPAGTRAGYDKIAQSLGLSSNALMGTVLLGALQADVDPTATTTRAIADRVIEVHTAHGLSLPQMVDVRADDALTLAILGDHERLLAWVTSSRLVHIARDFGVKPAWLEGEDTRTIDSGPIWYKQAPAVASRLTDLLLLGQRPRIQVIRSRSGTTNPEAPDEMRDRDGIAVAISWHHTLAGHDVRLYEWRGADRWTYPKARYELSALIRWAYAAGLHGIEMQGIVLSDAIYDQLIALEILPAQVLSNAPSGWSPLGMAQTGVAGEQHIEAEMARYDHLTRLLDDPAARRARLAQLR